MDVQRTFRLKTRRIRSYRSNYANLAAIMTIQNRTLPLASLFRGSVTDLLHPPQGQIPFLDALRTIAVLLVINGHLTVKFVESFGSNLYSRIPFVANGWIGVDLFFILSGFFIGGQLWKELQKTGTVRVGRFILRRGFRIWPLYFSVFICVSLISFLFGNGTSAKEFGWSDLVFITNYHNRGIVMGSWSLCTEEQFYIGAPVILFLWGPRMPSLSRFRTWLWSLMLAVLLLRIAIWTFVTGSFFAHNSGLFSWIYYASITHCDGLVMGMIISNLWVLKESSGRWRAKPAILLAVATGILVLGHIIQKETMDFTILALWFGAITWFGLQRRFAIFNSRIFYWFSRLSFGMYLNHEYMIPWIIRSILPRIQFLANFHIGLNLAGVVLLVCMSAGISIVTFCCIEYPFLQLRKALLFH